MKRVNKVVVVIFSLAVLWAVLDAACRKEPRLQSDRIPPLTLEMRVTIAEARLKILEKEAADRKRLWEDLRIQVEERFR